MWPASKNRRLIPGAISRDSPYGNAWNRDSTVSDFLRPVERFYLGSSLPPEPPVLPLRIGDLNPRRVLEHEPGEVAARRRGVDPAAESMPRQERQPPAMVEMRHA